MRRLLRWKRLRWFAAGAIVRFVLRRVTARSVDQAAADFEERLPAPVRKVLDVVPADAVRAGSTAVVAGRSARRMATGTRRASQAVGDGRRRIVDGVDRLRSIGDDIVTEADLRQRELKAEYLRATEGNGPADDVLLDLRPEVIDGPTASGDELPELVEPIRRGRWRADRRLGAPSVNRVQRSYRPRSKPWDR